MDTNEEGLDQKTQVESSSENSLPGTPTPSDSIPASNPGIPADSTPAGSTVQEPNVQTKGQKVMDFFIGFLGFGISDVVLFWGSYMLIDSMASATGNYHVTSYVPLVGIVLFLLNIAGIVYFARRRTYIMIGILSLFATPFLFLGGCLVTVLIGGAL